MKKIVSSVLVALFVSIAILAPSAPAEAQVVSNRCCDSGGNVRCTMNVYAPLGESCFCYGQGYGYVC